MYSFTLLVSVGAVLVFIFLEDIKVTAAPTPRPCLWMLDFHRKSPEPSTTTKPKSYVLEDLARLENKKTDQFIADWIMWGPTLSSEVQTQKPRSKNALERMLSGYMKFLGNMVRTL